VSVEELFAWLKEQQHTGTVTIHLLHGTPKRIEVPRQPQIITLDSSRKPARLDTVV
jgi:hypothetical protein